MTGVVGPGTALFAATCGFAAAVAWGIADFFGALAARANSPTHAAGAVQCLGTVAFGLAYFLVLDASGELDLDGLAYGTGGGVFMALGLATFYKALESGPVSIVSPLSSAYPLVTTALATALFAARPTGLQIAGVGLIMAGVVACSGIAEAKRSQVRPTRGIKLGVATFALWGVAFAMLDQGVDRLGWETCTLVQLAAGATAFGILLSRDPRSLSRLPQVIGSRYVLCAGLILLAGNMAMNIGLATSAVAGVAIVTSISSCYPALTILLGLRRFGEEIRVVPLSGAFVTITGAITLSVA